MTEIYIILAFVLGAASVYFAMMPQMRLLRSMLAEKQKPRTIWTAPKKPEEQAPQSNSPPQHPIAEFAPPDYRKRLFEGEQKQEENQRRLAEELRDMRN